MNRQFEDTASKRVNDFLSDGVNITSNATVNEPGDGHVVWNFRAAPGFFDVLSLSGMCKRSPNV